MLEEITERIIDVVMFLWAIMVLLVMTALLTAALVYLLAILLTNL